MNLLKLGKVVKLRGFKGEFVIETNSTDLSRFSTLKTVVIDNKEFQIEYIKFLNKRLGIKLFNVNSEDNAKEFLGKEVYYDKDSLKSDKLYIEDYIGFFVKDEKDFLYGKFEDILNYGAGNILVVKSKNTEYLLPQNKNFITNIDIKNKTIFVDGKLIEEVI